VGRGHRALIGLLALVALLTACSDDAAPKSESATAPRQRWYAVEKVTDGDTIRVDLDGVSEPVRLIGIDAAEVRGGDAREHCRADLATETAKRILGKHRVRLEFDPTQGRRDRYERLLAFVWVEDGPMLNEELLREGVAEEYTYDDPYRYLDRFVAAEAKARRDQVGQWSPATCR
jgi:micrococcal nuclease